MPSNKIETILDCIADGVFTVDNEFRITSFNKAAERITGFTRKEAVGQFCFEIFRTDVCFVKCPLKESIKTGKEITNLELSILDKNNREIPVSVSTSVLKDKKGKIIGGVETFRDLSLIKEMDKEIKEKYTFNDIVSRNKKIREIFNILPDVAKSDVAVLIVGESGTGKELFANAIHHLSNRKNGPFIKINCGAIPETLLESELFGYKKGAFTDAKKDKAGRFQLAQGGTILLDEIGDLPKSLQVKLLRVLETKEFEPLGSTISEKADVRILSSTNRPLEKLVEDGKFREDLYYRLNVIKIEIPPLRERKEDIPILIDHFIEKFNRKMRKNIKGVTAEAMEILLNHSYPGNVREMENILEHGFILSKGSYIDRSHLPLYLQKIKKSKIVAPKINLKQWEAEIIKNVIKKHNGNLTKAAKELGIHRTTLWRKLKRI